MGFFLIGAEASLALFAKLLNPAAKGGPGSGFHGHAGRPGEVGGSAPREAGASNSAWQPTMSLEQAEAWAAGSATPGKYIHVTNAEAAEQIEKEGFRVDLPASAQYYGEGVYLTKEKGSAFYGDHPLEVRVKVKNPYIYLPQPEATTQEPLARISTSPLGKQMQALLDREPTLRKPQAVTRILQEMGYDAVITREDEDILVVFDPRHIVVVERKRSG